MLDKKGYFWNKRTENPNNSITDLIGNLEIAKDWKNPKLHLRNGEQFWDNCSENRRTQLQEKNYKISKMSPSFISCFSF